MAGGRAALFQVALVVFFGAIKGTGGGDLRGDRLAEFSAGLPRGFGFFRRGLLFRRVKENCRAILAAEVRALPVHLRGIVHLPKGVQQFLVAQFRWVERDLHHFGVSGFVRAHVFVVWIYGVAPAVTHRGVHDSGDLPECGFDPPKTSRSKRRRLCHGLSLHRSILPCLGYAIRCGGVPGRFGAGRRQFDAAAPFARAWKFWRAPGEWTWGYKAAWPSSPLRARDWGARSRKSWHAKALRSRFARATRKI